MVPGDRLGILPTSYEPEALDDVVVTSYDVTSGKVVVDKPMTFYHWGQD